MAAAQSSQFGIRGLGLPGRSLSTYAFGTGGALGMFDPASRPNPPPPGRLPAPTAGLSSPPGLPPLANPAGAESPPGTPVPLSLGGRAPQKKPPAVGVP